MSLSINDIITVPQINLWMGFLQRFKRNYHYLGWSFALLLQLKT